MQQLYANWNNSGYLQNQIHWDYKHGWGLQNQYKKGEDEEDYLQNQYANWNNSGYLQNQYKKGEDEEDYLQNLIPMFPRDFAGYVPPKRRLLQNQYVKAHLPAVVPAAMIMY